MPPSAEGAPLSERSTAKAAVAVPAPAAPLEEVLRPDGTLDLSLGFTGSLDPTGWKLVSGPSEAPRFARAAGDIAPKSSTDAPLVAGDENWDSRFNPVGVGGYVLAVAVSGSDVYVGGQFITAGTVNASRIARWNGSQWFPLGSGVNGDVYEIAVSGSDIYVGGEFTQAGGASANYIARWNGSQWFPLGSGVGSRVEALAVTGTTVYAGGTFTTAGGVPVNRIAKWDGSSWSSFGGGVTGGDLPGVFEITVNGTDVYVGGRFTTAGAVSANRIARWDGAQWSALGSGLGNDTASNVVAIKVVGTNVYAGGTFTVAGGASAVRIARWDGTQWFPLGSGITGALPFVGSIGAIGTDIYVSGRFFTAGGVSVQNVAKWNGTGWSALGTGVGNPGTFETAYELAVGGNDVYVGGGFTLAGDQAAHNVARWNGSQWSALGTGLGVPEDVQAIAVAGSNVYIGGRFTSAGGTRANNIARWDGSQWSALGNGLTGLSGGFLPTVYAITVSGNDLYVGGIFTTAGAVSANNVARWNGTEWSALGSGIGGGSSPRVFDIALIDSNVYFGGSFSTAGGASARNIAMWDGSSWSALGSGIGDSTFGYVNDIVALGSDIYAAGGFTTAGGVNANHIARWNGTEWSALGSGLGSNVNALATNGTDIFVGGIFTTAGGASANYIAKWNGTEWSALGSGTGGLVSALAVSGTDLYVTGSFTTAGGAGANSIARWNGAQWSALGSGLASAQTFISVYALAAGGSDVYVGGSFTQAGGKPSSKFGIYHASPSGNPTPTSTVTPGGCNISFSDVPEGSTFHPYVICLACRDILGGYADNTFRPQNQITRGQIAKIVSNAAGYTDDVSSMQTYTDVPSTQPFHLWIERLSMRGHMGGYNCGGAGEPCDGANRPYFRPGNNASRGQLSKIVSNAADFTDTPEGQTFEDVPPSSPFYPFIERLTTRGVMSGYPCGGPGEPCSGWDMPYFRPSSNVTRGQASKIVANTFFPECAAD
ncbi:MAG TPA: S-layer homology domain-containing protein [Chloroflexia bacterium]